MQSQMRPVRLVCRGSLPPVDRRIRGRESKHPNKVFLFPGSRCSGGESTYRVSSVGLWGVSSEQPSVDRVSSRTGDRVSPWVSWVPPEESKQAPLPTLPPMRAPHGIEVVRADTLGFPRTTRRRAVSARPPRSPGVLWGLACCRCSPPRRASAASETRRSASVSPPDGKRFARCPRCLRPGRGDHGDPGEPLVHRGGAGRLGHGRLRQVGGRGERQRRPRDPTRVFFTRPGPA